MFNIPNVQELPSVSLEDRSQLPEASSIYFAIDSNNVIQYIGRTTNLNKRWASTRHHRYQELNNKSGVRIAYLKTDDDLLDEIEEALIKHFEPPLNNSKILSKRKTPTKSLTLSQEAIDFVDRERKETGLTFSAQVNMYLLKLSKENANIELININ